MPGDEELGAEVRSDGKGGLTAGGVEKAKKKPAPEDAQTDEEKRKKPAEGAALTHDPLRDRRSALDDAGWRSAACQQARAE